MIRDTTTGAAAEPAMVVTGPVGRACSTALIAWAPVTLLPSRSGDSKSLDASPSLLGPQDWLRNLMKMRGP